MLQMGPKRVPSNSGGVPSRREKRTRKNPNMYLGMAEVACIGEKPIFHVQTKYLCGCVVCGYAEWATERLTTHLTFPFLPCYFLTSLDSQSWLMNIWPLVLTWKHCFDPSDLNVSVLPKGRKLRRILLFELCILYILSVFVQRFSSLFFHCCLMPLA